MEKIPPKETPSSPDVVAPQPTTASHTLHGRKTSISSTSTDIGKIVPSVETSSEKKAIETGSIDTLETPPENVDNLAKNIVIPQTLYQKENEKPSLFLKEMDQFLMHTKKEGDHILSEMRFGEYLFA